MLIKDLDKVFKTLDGQNMKVNVQTDNPGTLGGEKIKQRDLTLREVMTNSLLSPRSQDQIDGAEKARRYFLAMEIHSAKKEVNLSVDDIKTIKDLVGKIYPPLIVGQAFEALDPPKGKAP